MHDQNRRCQEKRRHERIGKHRPGDQLYDRRGGVDGRNQQGHGPRRQAAAEQHNQDATDDEENEREQLGGEFAAQQIERGEAPLRRHRHDGPTDLSDVEMPGVVGRHVHRDHEVYRDSIGAHFGLEAHQELGAQYVQQQGHRPVVGRGLAAGTRRAERHPDANPDVPAAAIAGMPKHQAVDGRAVPRSEG